MLKYGVIDLGTNTFHLLIITISNDGDLKEVERKRVFVKLAENGIHTIGPNPYKRGMDTLSSFHTLLQKHQVKKVKAIGTAALRTATNGANFIEDVKEQIGLNIEIISGSEEAALIQKGVIKAVDFGEEKGLIMDIGGGSIEFIISDKQKVYWARSFPIGVAILYRKFHHQDPISQESINQLNAYLATTVQPLFLALKKHKLTKLIGASGTFDVLELFLAKERQTAYSAIVPIEAFFSFYEKLIALNLEERLQIKDLPASRADLIIVALILIHFIVKKTRVKEIVASDYAMKEGMLFRMIEQENNA